MKKDGIFFLLLAILTILVFYPVVFGGKTSFSANVLANAFYPWAAEKQPGWHGGIPNKPIGLDDIRIFYPQRLFTLSAARVLHQIPLWNPYSYSGNYHIGLSETAVFYPLSFVFFILSGVDAWNVLMMVQPVLVGLGMYLFLRLLVKRHLAAGMSALLWAFSYHVIVRLSEGLSVGHTFLWMPWVLWSAESYLGTRKLRYLWVLLFGSAASLLSGWFQFTFYVVGFSGLYVVFRLWAERETMTKNYWRLLIFLPYFVLPLVGAFHILPSLRMLSESPRGLQVERILLDQHLLPIQHYLTILFPDLFGNPGTYNYFGKSNYPDALVSVGVSAFFFAILSLYRFKKFLSVRFFWVIVIGSILLTFDNPLTRFLLSLPIPLWSTFIPDRILIIASFFLVVLAAYGIDWLLLENRVKGRSVVVPLFIGVGVSVVLGSIVFALWTVSKGAGLPTGVAQDLLRITKISQFSTMMRNIIVPTAIMVFLIVWWFVSERLTSRRMFVIGAGVLGLVQLFYGAFKYIPFSERQFVFPEHPVFTFLQKSAGIDRVVSLAGGHIVPNVPLTYLVQSPEGLGSMYIKRYGELIRYATTDDKRLSYISRIEARIEPSPGILTGQEKSEYLRFFQIDGVRYLVVLNNEIKNLHGHTVDSKVFSLAWSNPTWSIYAFNQALPRYFLSGSYAVEPDREKELRAIFDTRADPRRILLEKKPVDGIDETVAGNVELLSYTPNEIVFRATSSTSKLLYLSDAWSSAFKATVDSVPTRILRANYAFRAVEVPQGVHTVRMYYDMSEIMLGFWIAGTTLAVCVIASVSLRKSLPLK